MVLFWGLLGAGLTLGGTGVPLIAMPGTGFWGVLGWCLLVGALVCLGLAFRVWRHEHKDGSGHIDARLRDRVTHELVAIIDEGEALGPSVYSPPGHGPYVIWRDKGTAFIETVFGAAERQRFNEPFDPPPTSVSRNVKDHLRRLGDLRDRPDTWELQINEEGLRKAIAERRSLSYGERIVVADAPASFPNKKETLPDWLGTREGEIRRLQADLVEQLGAGFDFKRVDSIQRAFWRVNDDVAHRLRLDAREWADQFERNPDWFDSVVTRITPEQFQEVVRIMAYTADQIAEIRSQMGSSRISVNEAEGALSE